MGGLLFLSSGKPGRSDSLTQNRARMEGVELYGLLWNSGGRGIMCFVFYWFCYELPRIIV